MLKSHLLFACTLGLTLAAHAVDWGDVKQYPNIGLSLPIFRQAKSNPLPPPESPEMLVTLSGSELHRQDLFNRYELWYAGECCARWSDAAGNQLVIGKMSRSFSGTADAKTTREDFATARYAAGANGRDAGVVNNWVAAFSGLTLDAPVKIKLNAFHLSSVLFFNCPASPSTLVYAVSPRLSATEPVWYAVIFTSAETTDAETLRASFAEDFLLRLRVPGRFNEKAGEKAETLELPRRFTLPADQPNHPVRLEARKPIENYSDWWIYETEGYVILSDVNTGTGREFVQKFQTQLVTLRKAFLKAVPPITADRDVGLVRVFRDRTDYLAYVGSDRSWTAGLWMPRRRELVTYFGENTATLLSTLRHESFHQYLFSAYCGLEAPPWFNEGHATLFEGAEIDKGIVKIDGSDRYESYLEANLDTALAMFPDFLQMDYDDFQSGTSDEILMKYALAWGTTYFLQKTSQSERNAPFSYLLKDYPDLLSRERDYAKAVGSLLANFDAEKFRSAFAAFWTKRQGGPILFKP